MVFCRNHYSWKQNYKLHVLWDKTFFDDISVFALTFWCSKKSDWSYHYRQNRITYINKVNKALISCRKRRSKTLRTCATTFCSHQQTTKYVKSNKSFLTGYTHEYAHVLNFQKCLQTHYFEVDVKWQRLFKYVCIRCLTMSRLFRNW